MTADLAQLTRILRKPLGLNAKTGEVIPPNDRMTIR
jgi:hypothetical protein